MENMVYICYLLSHFQNLIIFVLTDIRKVNNPIYSFLFLLVIALFSQYIFQLESRFMYSNNYE